VINFEPRVFLSIVDISIIPTRPAWNTSISLEEEEEEEEREETGGEEDEDEGEGEGELACFGRKFAIRLPTH